jgi:hypothetical protein
MQLVQPLPRDPSSLANARTHLSDAMGVVGVVSSGPSLPSGTAERLWDGVRLAKLAAADLFLAEPESDYQDLVRARTQVLEGAALIEQAISAYGSAQGVDPTMRVKQLALEAYQVFDDTFEILDNN